MGSYYTWRSYGKIGEQRALVLDAMRAEGISEPRNLEEQARLLIGNDIYEKLIKVTPRNSGDANVQNFHRSS